MRLRPAWLAVAGLAVAALAVSGRVCAAQATEGQNPPGAEEALQSLCSQPATHTVFTFDKDMLQGLVGDDSDAGQRVAAELNSITFESYHYHEPAFYLPEEMRDLWTAFNRAGWKHLVDANASARDSATPEHPIADLWLHFNGADIDHVTVLVRARHQMTVIEVSGALRPLDLVHLSGHFGIPKVDPGAVMVPAPTGR